jgi:hypothetical protein
MRAQRPIGCRRRRSPGEAWRARFSFSATPSPRRTVREPIANAPPAAGSAAADDQRLERRLRQLSEHQFAEDKTARMMGLTNERFAAVLKRKAAKAAYAEGRHQGIEANVSAAFIDLIIRRYEGTRLGRQELHAELLTDTPGALWPYQTILNCRTPRAPDLQRVVVAVDPSGSNGSDEGDCQGIAVAGLGVDGLGYVLADRTCRLSPQGWGRRTIEAFDAFAADRIVTEKNFGGEMVRFTLQAVRRTAPVVLVNALRGKCCAPSRSRRSTSKAACSKWWPIRRTTPWPNSRRRCGTLRRLATSARDRPTGWTPWSGR